MHSEGFEPAIPAVERLQTYALDRTATGIGNSDLYRHDSRINFHRIRLTALKSINLNTRPKTNIMLIQCA
jgi:hypothetical protein